MNFSHATSLARDSLLAATVITLLSIPGSLQAIDFAESSGGDIDARSPFDLVAGANIFSGTHESGEPADGIDRWTVVVPAGSAITGIRWQYNRTDPYAVQGQATFQLDSGSDLFHDIPAGPADEDIQNSGFNGADPSFPLLGSTHTFYVSGGVVAPAASWTVTVTVGSSTAPPRADAGPDQPVCSGQAVEIGKSPSLGAPPYTFSWSPTTGLSSPTVQRPSANPLFTTTYTVTVTDANGMTDTDSVVVSVADAPADYDESVSGDLQHTDQRFALCPGDNVFRGTHATGTDNDPTDRFTVVVPHGSVIASIRWQYARFDPHGVQAETSFLIDDGTVLDHLVAPGPANQDLLDSGFSSTDPQLPIPAGEFAVIISGGPISPAASWTVTFSVTEESQALRANAGEDKTISAGNGDPAPIGGSPAAEFGSPPYTYSWSPASGLISTTTATTQAQPDATTAYTLTVTDSNGDTATDSVTVFVVSEPTDYDESTDGDLSGQEFLALVGNNVWTGTHSTPDDGTDQFSFLVSNGARVESIRWQYHKEDPQQLGGKTRFEISKSSLLVGHETPTGGGVDLDIIDSGFNVQNPTLPLSSGLYTVTIINQEGGLSPAASWSVTIVVDDPPEIDLRGGGFAIANGDTTPSSVDGTNFGSAATGQNVSRTFTVANQGGRTLSVSGNPRVAIGGENPGDFSVTSQPPALIGKLSDASFAVTFSPLGPRTRTATVSIANNDADENPYVFLIQGEGPPADTPTIAGDDITVNTDPGQCSAVVDFSPAVTGLPAPSVTCSPASGTSFPLGTTSVSCVATNSEGTASCTFEVTVVDNAEPTITCPANVEVSADSPSGTFVTFSASATDLCDPSPSIVCSPDSGSLFPIGETVVTCTATDASGNTETCTFIVKVLFPEEMLDNAIETLDTLPIRHEVKNGLLVRLMNALSNLAAGNEPTGLMILDAFKDHGEAQRGTGLTDQQVDELVSLADAAIAAIGDRSNGGAPGSLFDYGNRLDLNSASDGPIDGQKLRKFATFGIDDSFSTLFSVEWTAEGVLESAPHVDGPWNAVPSAASPFWHETLRGESALFFRLRIEE